MGYSESICFSAAPVEELNKKAFLLNRSLFLFAYYEPKPFIEKESNRSKFSTAIINLYGLFWDCGPFVFQLLYSKDSILLYDWTRVQTKANSIRDCVSAFRSIFCHNNSDQFPLNEEKVMDAIAWAALPSYGWQDLDEITEAGWDALLRRLTTQADSLIKDIDAALDALLTTGDMNRRDSAIERWIQQIALGYQKNPDYLLNTMVGLYQLYLLNSNSTRDYSQNLRHLTIRWICSIGNSQPKTWFVKWLNATEPDGCDGSIITNTKIYNILKDWPNKWADWNSCSALDCDEAPLPASVFFRILASDVDQYARNPNLGPVAFSS